MLKELIQKTAYAIAPRLAADWHARWKLWEMTREAAALRRKLDSCRSVEEQADAVIASVPFASYQMRTEIAALLKLVLQLQPRYVCEIGSHLGGTLLLFCQAAAPQARILSVDIAYLPPRFQVYQGFGRAEQKVTCMEANSQLPETVERVRHWLDGHLLDFLFIDGDHSLAGVSRDFELFSPLVRRGGLIAFHDIVPDHKTRYGRNTGSYAGEVHKFWADLKNCYPQWQELIDHPDQDAYGIGVVEWPGAS